MHAKCRAQKRESRTPTGMEAIQASFEREDINDTLADHLISEKYPSEVEHQMRAERTTAVS